MKLPLLLASSVPSAGSCAFISLICAIGLLISPILQALRNLFLRQSCSDLWGGRCYDLSTQEEE